MILNSRYRSIPSLDNDVNNRLRVGKWVCYLLFALALTKMKLQYVKVCIYYGVYIIFFSNM